MNKVMPKVSIIIPVYNGANFLDDAIRSALAQTYENIEILVVNDGSDDLGKTEEIAKSYGDKIRYFSKPNGGVSTALNLGISVMEGDYFSWLSHDDVYFPTKTEVQIAFLKRLGRDAVLYSDYEYIDEASRYIKTKKVPDIPPGQFRMEMICRSEIIHGCTLLIPRTFLLEVGRFDESLHTIQDYDLWLRMAECYDFVHMPDVLISSRVHAGQGVRSRRTLWQSECSHFYTEHLQRIFQAWDDFGADSSLAVFSVKAAIKMERFGLPVPIRLCRSALRKSFWHELIRFNLTFFYWISYYALFKVKRTLTS